MLQDISYISHYLPSLSTSAAPLTVDSVLTAVQGVAWRTLGEVLLAESCMFGTFEGAESKLNKIQGQHQSDADRLHAVVNTWVQGRRYNEETSWRHLIYVTKEGSVFHFSSAQVKK